jgi:hypothetical protein
MLSTPKVRARRRDGRCQESGARCLRLYKTTSFVSRSVAQVIRELATEAAQRRTIPIPWIARLGPGAWKVLPRAGCHGPARTAASDSNGPLLRAAA